MERVTMTIEDCALAIPELGRKRTRWPKIIRRRDKGTPAAQHTTNGHQANSPKGNRMIDCFGEFDPNVVHSTNAVVRWSGLSFGSPARSPSVPASCRPAAAVLRRVASRSRSVGRPSLETRVARHTSGGLTVGCQLLRQRQQANIEGFSQQRT